MSRRRVAVVAGATGIAGRALVEHLYRRDDWDVVGVSRRPLHFTGVRHINVDLLDARDCAQKLSALSEATHLFYCAFAPLGGGLEEVGPNFEMLRNVTSALERAASNLEHVQLLQGTKWYGHHLGPFRTPAREDDPRHLSPNYYYVQQNWIEDAQRGKSWTWSALRPHCICGVSVGSPMNHLFALALYAVISRELGVPLRFPGAPSAFQCIYQFTDARLLARAMVWAATTGACANQAFNINNGEFERWENIWPALADRFGMATGRVQTVKLVDVMIDKESVWSGMRRKYGLRENRLADLIDWRFADWSYSNGFDQMSSLTKARRAGWSEVLDTETMFRQLIDELEQERWIPPRAV